VYDKYASYVDSFDWNTQCMIPVVPAFQILESELEGFDIAETGFEITVEQQNGKFGQGLYFTTDSINVYHSNNNSSNNSNNSDDNSNNSNDGNKDNNTSLVLMISLTIPGNVYPVVEQHSDNSVSLIGNPIIAGYNSHFVLTTKDGNAIQSKEEASNLNELIVAQESQVLPAFIVHVNLLV